VKQSISSWEKTVVLVMVMLVMNISMARSAWTAEADTLASAAKITENEPGGQVYEETAVGKKKSKIWLWILLIAALAAGGAAAMGASSSEDGSDGGSAGEGSVEATW